MVRTGKYEIGLAPLSMAIVFIILSIHAIFLSACNNDDVRPIDLNLFEGNWEVAATYDQDLFGRKCILEISSSDSNWSDGSAGIKRGKITSYYINGTGNKFYDKIFYWSIGEKENGELFLSLELEEQIDSDDSRTDSIFLKITKLNNAHMWWEANSIGSKGTIKMRRRTDL